MGRNVGRGRGSRGQTVRRAAAVLALAVAVAACGDDDGASGSTTTSTAGGSTSSSAPGGSTTFATRTFEVPFRLELPEGWTAVERDVDLVQLWVGVDEEEAPFEISIGFDVVGTPQEVMEAYSSIDGTTATEPEARSYGGFDALQLEIEAQQAGPAIPGGYRMGAGGRARIAAIDVGDRTLVVLMDPFTDIDPDADHEALYAQMAAVLSTLELVPPPQP